MNAASGAATAVSCTRAPTITSVIAADAGLSNCAGGGWDVDGTVVLSDGLPAGFEIAWYFGASNSDPPTTSFVAVDTNLTRSFQDGDIGSDGPGGSQQRFARVGAELRIIADSTICDGKDDSSSINRTANTCFV